MYKHEIKSQESGDKYVYTTTISQPLSLCLTSTSEAINTVQPKTPPSMEGLLQNHLLQYACCSLVVERPSNILEYFRDGSAQTILHAVTLRKKLQIKLSTSPSHSLLTLGQPVPALTLYRQPPDRLAAGMPVFKSLVWLDPEKSCHKWDLNPGSSALKADASPLDQRSSR